MKPRWGPGKPLETSGSDPVGGRMRLREKASGQTGQWELTGLWKTLEQNSETERERLRGRERERERESKRQRERERDREREISQDTSWLHTFKAQMSSTLPGPARGS